MLWLLSVSLAVAQVREVAIEIAVIEGNGETYPVASRAYRGLTVEVTDAQGAPVPRARVVFRMPESGPAGIFVSGGSEEVSFTDSRGRTSAWGIQWNGVPGECRVSIFVSSGPARAGTAAIVKLTGEGTPAVLESPAAPARVEAARVRMKPKPEDLALETTGKRPGVVLSRTDRRESAIPSSKAKWALIALGIGGAVGAGVYWKMASQRGPTGGVTAPPAVVNPVPTRPAIGNPTITIGRP